MKSLKRLALAAAFAAVVAVAGAGAPSAAPTVTCTLPPGNAARQWDLIAQSTAVSATAFQTEAFIYLAYANGGRPMNIFKSRDSVFGYAEVNYKF